MNKNKNIEGKNKYVKMKFIAIISFFIACGILCFFVIYKVNAKYITKDYGKGVTKGSGFYFSSDYLNPIGDEDDYCEYIMYGWDGKTKKSFAFNVRNYDNLLLYNDKDTTVNYNISMEISDEDKELVDIELYKRVNEEYVVAPLSEVLEGVQDEYHFIEYKLSVTPKENAVIDHDIQVLIKANTFNSSYEKEIATYVTLQYTPFSEFIFEQGFNNPEAEDYAFQYFIHTANGAVLSEMENTNIKIATKVIELTWNNKLVELSQFDSLNGEEFSTMDISQVEGNIYDYKNIVIVNEETSILYFDALPYSAFDITFYKKAGIGNLVWKDENGEYIWINNRESIVNAKEIDIE